MRAMARRLEKLEANRRRPGDIPEGAGISDLIAATPEPTEAEMAEFRRAYERFCRGEDVGTIGLLFELPSPPDEPPARPAPAPADDTPAGDRDNGLDDEVDPAPEPATTPQEAPAIAKLRAELASIRESRPGRQEMVTIPREVVFSDEVLSQMPAPTIITIRSWRTR